MQTLYEILNQTINNRTITFANRTAILADGSVIVFRLRMKTVNPGASLSISMDVTFPSGTVKHLDLFANAVGSYQRGGWSGGVRGGVVSASGSVTATGKVVVDAYIVSFERGEDVPEWE